MNLFKNKISMVAIGKADPSLIKANETAKNLMQLTGTRAQRNWTTATDKLKWEKDFIYIYLSISIIYVSMSIVYGIYVSLSIIYVSMSIVIYVSISIIYVSISIIYVSMSIISADTSEH